jgi:hypothetical protein
LQAEGIPRAGIVRHLIDKYALTPAAATATYHRWAKRRVQLARPKINKPELVDKRIKTQLQGTRLAFHLLELAKHYETSRPKVAEWAKRALYSRTDRPWDYNVVPKSDEISQRSASAFNDPFWHLGEQLQAFTSPTGTAVKGHNDPDEPAARIGKAYNWGNIATGLMHEQHMRNWLKEHVKTEHAGKFTDREIFRRAERLFDADPEAKEKYLNAARAKYGAHAPSIEQLHDAVRRLTDKELEREQLVGGYTKPTSIDGRDTHHWKDSHSWINEAKHARFAREKRQWISQKIRRLVKEGKDVKQAAAIAYDMWDRGERDNG